MKILNLSLDQQLLKKDSVVAKRLGRLAETLDGIDFVVPSQKKIVFYLNDKAQVIGSGGITKFDRLFLLWRISRQLLSSRAYNLLTVQDVYLIGLVGLILGRQFELPVEIQVHGFEKMTWLRKIVAKLVLTKAKGVRVVSLRLRNQLIAEFGIAAEKIYIIPIISPNLNRGEKRLMPVNQLPYLVAIGRLVPVKGFDLLIKAMAIVKEKGVNFRLDIVGEGGEYYHLKKLINQLDLANEIVLQEPTTNLATYYSRADILVISSYQEGYSLVAVEAASFGLPIVMTDVGLAGEVLIDNESAKIVPVGQKDLLAKTIINLLEDKEEAEKIAERAYRVAQNLPTEPDSFILYKAAWAKLL